MTVDQLRILFRRTLPMALLLPGALFTGGCGDREAGAREAQFLTRRIEKLEEKVNALEARVNLAPSQGSSFGATEGSAGIAGAAAPLPVSIGGAVTDRLGNEEDRARVFLLKATRLQSVPRPQLAAMIAEMGIPAPELGVIETKLRGLEEEKGRLLSDPAADPNRMSEVSTQIEELKYSLEIAAEGVRRRVIEEGKQLSAKVEAMRQEGDTATGTGSPPAPGSP